MSRLPLLLALAACVAEDEALDLREPAPVLELPDLGGVDLEVAFADALAVALRADARVAWDGHAAGLARQRPGCPDLYVGSPDLDDRDVPNRGLSWADHCRTGDGEVFGGFAWWEDALAVEGEVTDLAGMTAEASRALLANGVMADADDVPRWQFNGEARDALMLVEGEDFGAWTYSSVLRGTLLGVDTFDAETLGVEGGWRVDMYVRSTGGDTGTVEVRGNLYLYEHRIAGRFDSVSINLLWGAPESMGPDDCVDEPRGWIGVRDEDAHWFDLVFQPRYDNNPNAEPYQDVTRGACDGCGALYARGLEQLDLTVCPDLSFLWDGALTHPAPTDFVLDPRSLLREMP